MKETVKKTSIGEQFGWKRICRAILIFNLFFSLASLKGQINKDLENQLQQQKQQFERSLNVEKLQKQRKLDKQNSERKLGDQIIIADSLNKDDKECFKLDSIVFNGGHFLSPRRQKKLVGPFLNICITPVLLRTLIKDVNNDYIRRGYSTARVYLQSQNIRFGKLELLVILGKLEKVHLEGLDQKKFFTKTKIWTAFGNPKDKVFNLRHLEQGVEQLNRLISYKSTIKIIPSSKKKSYSIAQIIREKQMRSTRIRLSTNNNGQNEKNRYNGKIIFEQDNLLQLNEVFYGAFTNNLSFNTGNEHSRNFYFSLEIPLNWWTLSGSYIRSSYLNTIIGSNTVFETSGISSVNNYKLKRMLFRDQTSKVDLSLGINLKNTESFIEDVKNEVGSRSLTVLNIGVNYSNNARWGYLNSNFSYVAGLKWFDALKDVAPFDNFTPRAQYQKYALLLDYYKNFVLAKHQFVVQSHISAQFSETPLFASEQISIGGAYSIRSFRNKSILGDDGFYLTNTFSYYLPSFFKSSGTQQIFIGYDFGYVLQKGGKQANFGEGEGGLSAVATGIRFNNKKLQFDITYAQSIKTEYFIGNEDTLYFNLTLRIF